MAALVVFLVLIGLAPGGSSPPPSQYQLTASAYGVTLTVRAPAASFNVTDLEGPFAIKVTTPDVPVHGVLTVGGEIVFDAVLSSMTYVYPYEKAVSGPPEARLVLTLPSGAQAASVTVELGVRMDLHSYPAISGDAVPLPSGVSLQLPPFRVGLSPSADLPTTRLDTSAWTPPASLDTCYGSSAVVQGGFWINVSAPHDVSFGFALHPGWIEGSLVEMHLTGNVTFHAHAPSSRSMQVNAAVCKPSSVAPLGTTIDGG